MLRPGFRRLSETFPYDLEPQNRSHGPPRKTVTVLPFRSTIPACWAASQTFDPREWTRVPRSDPFPYLSYAQVQSKLEPSGIASSSLLKSPGQGSRSADALGGGGQGGGSAVMEKVAVAEEKLFETTPFAAEPQRRGQSGCRQKVTVSPGRVNAPA